MPRRRTLRTATLLRKHSRWQYEDEYRVSIPDAAGKFIPFRPEALTGIILGCRADEAAEAAVRSLLEERAARHLPALRIYRARRNARRYDIDLMAAG